MSGSAETGGVHKGECLERVSWGEQAEWKDGEIPAERAWDLQNSINQI